MGIIVNAVERAAHDLGTQRLSVQQIKFDGLKVGQGKVEQNMKSNIRSGSENCPIVTECLKVVAAIE